MRISYWVDVINFKGVGIVDRNNKIECVYLFIDFLSW